MITFVDLINGISTSLGDELNARFTALKTAVNSLLVSQPHEFALTDAAAIAVDWANGPLQSVTLGGNRTFTFANPVDGATYRLRLKQDGAGSRTLTWPTITWKGGSAPVLSTTAGKTDLITLVRAGGIFFGSADLNY